MNSEKDTPQAETTNNPATAENDSAAETATQGTSTDDTTTVEVNDPDTAEAAAENAEKEIEEVTDFEVKYQQAKQEAEKNWDTALRLKADMDNLRKRTEKDVQNARAYGLEKFANALLPILDSMDMAIQSIDQKEGGAASLSENEKTMLEGINMTLKMSIDVLADNNIERINPLNDKFDPQLHEALTTMVDADKPENTVLNVVQIGYSLNGRLLRPARVIVSKTP